LAVGQSSLPTLEPVAGVRLGSTAAGVRKADELDLVVMELAVQSEVATVFTRNQFCAAPVQWAKAHVRAAKPRYLVINTGNANAGTGAAGERAVEQNCQALAALTGCQVNQVLPYSTGVIGELLPAERIDQALPAALANLSAEGWAKAADAIRTTDTRAKGRSCTLALAGGSVTLTGIAKGSGMIRPDMATMLAFIATDAVIAPDQLQAWLQAAVAKSFNRISVDGDTSTNDACTLVATGQSGVGIAAASDDAEVFVTALTTLCTELAREIVADGEGATKLLAVSVSGARSEAEAEQVGFCVAQSPLVKTALFAGDPNWGRILAAVGRAGVDDLVLTAVSIRLGEQPIVEHGGVSPSYNESAAVDYMAGEHIDCFIELGRGSAEATIWGCDLSYDYVRINAEYRS
jgi:glutamate N-acetyltransferase/amino-acid N-acetyltransferase